jgi:DNA-binding GntR family transcriptional regulator
MSLSAPSVSMPFDGATFLNGSPLKPLRPRALREMVFEVLLQAIVIGEMKAGDWLNHQQLAKRFEVSPTPVREALQQLALFGIVENQHNRGTVIRPFGPTQLEEIYSVRALLEAEATRLACKNLSSIQLQEIRSKTSELLSDESPDWATEAPGIDKMLHDFIAGTCGNQRLKEEIDRYHVFIFIPKVVPYPAHRQVLAEHIGIIDELLEQRADAAAKAIHDHIRSGAKLCNSLLFPDGKS